MESTHSLSNDPRPNRDPMGNGSETTANLLANLARAKVAFQLRTIEMVIRGPVQIAVESMLAEQARLQNKGDAR